MSDWKGIEEEAREWLVGVGYGEGRVIYSSEGVEHPTRDSLAALLRRAVAHGYRLCEADVYCDDPWRSYPERGSRRSTRIGGGGSG